MLYALAYDAAWALLGLLARWGWLSATDVELLALRHEARRLRRAGGRGAWRPADRLALAALSRCLPGRGWRVSRCTRPRSAAGTGSSAAADATETARDVGRDDRRWPRMSKP